MVALYLLTALSTGCVIASGVFAWLSWRESQQAQREAWSIRSEARMLRKQEAEIEQLFVQLKSLRGTMYKRTSPPDREHVDLETPAAETAEQARARLRKEHGLPMIRGNSGPSE